MLKKITTQLENFDENFENFVNRKIAEKDIIFFGIVFAIVAAWDYFAIVRFISLFR